MGAALMASEVPLLLVEGWGRGGGAGAAGGSDGGCRCPSSASLSSSSSAGRPGRCGGQGGGVCSALGGGRCLEVLRRVVGYGRGGGAERSSARKEKVTHVVFFDFDRTLTVVHVFKSLAGWVDQEVGMLGGLGAVARPHAMTEKGQLLRTCELGTAWIEQAFGGPARVNELRCLLAHLASLPGCRVVLLTRGYIGVAKKCLQALGLLEHFSEVYGNIGAAYGRKTKYDAAAEEADIPREVASLLGDEAHGSWESKAVIMLNYKQTWDLDRTGVIFIDDDSEEIWSVNHCISTVHVRSPAGITGVEVRELLRLASGGVEGDEEATGRFQSPTSRSAKRLSLRGWAALPDPLTCRPPPIMSFNRAHLPVLLGRHLASLEEELATCPNPMRRIKLLLREPLLLLSVAHREFVRHQLEGNAFTLKTMKPMLQCMQAQLGFSEDHVEVGEDDDDDVDKKRLIEHYECLRRCDSSDGSPSTVEDDLDVVVDADEDDSIAGSEHDSCAGISSRAVSKRRTMNLYTGPSHNAAKQANLVDPAKMLCSAVATFQRSLLGLTPITLTTAGDRRAIMGCHESRDLPSEIAIWTRYQKLERLGAGHFGEVYRAREVCSNKDVAIKTLERIEHGNQDCRSGIGMAYEMCDYNEASVLKGLSHPNLLRIFEAVKTEEEVLIITELAHGGSLSAWAKGNRNSGINWLPGAMQQITSAVAYCHYRHVLHGDLKPENVLVGGKRPDNSPLCIVCDFGHTTICIGAQTPIAAPGDPRYIAPEVMSEEFLSPKSDIYMLGVTAYELLSGGWLPFFNQKAVTLHASYYQLKLGGVKDRILEGTLSWKDWDKVKTSPQEAKDMLKAMIARNEAERPTALEVLQCAWLADACRPCKAAYDAMFGGSGWGLWSPQHPHFAQRLLHRAGQSWSFRMLCAFVGSGLHPEKIQRMRLLFRRMDTDGNGAITRKKFHSFTELFGFSVEDTDVLFKAADLTDQHFLDFKHLVMLYLDLGAFSDGELLQELRSCLSHLRGPVRPPDYVPPLMSPGTPLPRVASVPRLPRSPGTPLPRVASLRRVPSSSTPFSLPPAVTPIVGVDREASSLPGVPDELEFVEPAVERDLRVSEDPQIAQLLADIWARMDEDEPAITAHVLLRLLRSEAI